MINDYDNEQLHRLEPTYLERFGLTEAPFAASLDNRFFYPTAELTQQINMLLHMTQYSDMLLLVTGEEGLGKTALLQYYVKAAHENWHVCRINANSMMDMGQLLFRIAEGFGLESLPGNSEELQELLLDKLTRLHHNDILPVTIIDDAHELPQESLELLYRLPKRVQKMALWYTSCCLPIHRLKTPCNHPLSSHWLIALPIPLNYKH